LNTHTEKTTEDVLPKCAYTEEDITDEDIQDEKEETKPKSKGGGILVLW